MIAPHPTIAGTYQGSGVNPSPNVTGDFPHLMFALPFHDARTIGMPGSRYMQLYAEVV